jgi:hypothetical protein
MISFSKLPIALGLAVAAAQAATVDKTASACSNIPKPHVDGAQVVSLTSRLIKNGTIPKSLTVPNDITNINVCEVNVTLSHPGANDKVLVQTWLPLPDKWNSRYVSIGGGAWLAGQLAIDLAAPTSNGYAASSTDAGLTGASGYSPAGWALKKDGSVNTPLLTNFASRSIHDMAVVGKAVTASFYGKKAKHAYWNGCSTGGRQGMVAAQKYPHDFDGIAAGAPAIYWTQYVVAELWPVVVMKEAGYVPSLCELTAVVAKAVEACDKNDRVTDGVVNDPFSCKFDPFTLVGTKIPCETGNVTITSKTASIVRKIWDGPKTAQGASLWAGLPIGSSLAALTYTQAANGSFVPGPFFLAQQWVQYFVKQNPSFDVSSIGSVELRQIFAESFKKFDGIIGSANTDLSGFKAAGGKLLMWQGLADQLIPPQDTIRYLEEVEHRMGGDEATSRFARLFLAPGVDHCGYTTGAVPVDPLAALVSWVEDGDAPEYLDGKTLPGAASQFTRKICRYPLKAKYRGCGDANDAASYSCV